MPNVPDNEMEHFFRESADNYEIEFNSAAWEKMEKKLDKEDRKVFWWRLSILLSLGLIALMAGLFILSPLFFDENTEDSNNKQLSQHTLSNQKKGSKKKNLTTDKQDRDKSSSISKEMDDSNTKKSELKDNSYDKEDKLKQTIVDNSKADNSLAINDTTNTSGEEDEIAKETNKVDGDKGKTDGDTSGKKINASGGEGDTNNTKSVDKDDSILPILPDDEDPENATGKLAKDKEGDNGLAVGGNEKANKELELLFSKLLALQSVAPSVLTTVEQEKDSIEIETPITDTTAVAQKPPHKKSLYLNFSISPDLSGVGKITNNSGIKSGVKSGLLLEYQPLDKWSFYGGVYFSKKRYVAGVQDYSVPEGFWTMGETPIDIDAKCNILEIPVGVKFSPFKNANNAFFVSGGISSYLILREEYIYNYDTNYPPSRKGWLGKNENQHWFGITTLSIGYEKKLGARSAFQIEPYIHLPLDGVGFGKVNLFSYGTYFTLKYRLK